MRIAQLTPGAGGGFYCENCLRDGALVRAIGNAGHEIVLIPMYLPTGIDSTTVGSKEQVFYGGINVYLQQKLGLFRHTPRWLDRMFDSTKLLKWAASKATMTSSADLADTTISMLKGEQGKQTKELDRLINWLDQPENRPDVVILSNIMLIGLAKSIKKRLNAKVICLLQDEADFLDGLGDQGAKHAWQIISQRCDDVDLFISVSEYYAEVMRKRLNLQPDGVKVVYTGIDLEGYDKVSQHTGDPAIGFLSQMCEVKGLDVLTDAFIKLKQVKGLENLRLCIAGGQSGADTDFIAGIKDRIDKAGHSGSVDFFSGFDKDSKLYFFGSISVLCVPEKSPPAYGLYVIEANAAAVPVVQPAIGVFPELIDITAGGTTYASDSADALVKALEPYLLNQSKAHKAGIEGRKNVTEKFDINHTAAKLIDICMELCNDKG